MTTRFASAALLLVSCSLGALSFACAAAPAPTPVAAPSAPAIALQVAAPFGDRMVLQRQMPVPVWGTGTPEAQVSVSFAGQTKTTRANARGQWLVKLDAMEASADNRVLSVTCGEGGMAQKVEFKDVLVGEVWVGAGQSNMEMGVFLCLDGAKTLAGAHDPLLRVRAINKVRSNAPSDKLPTASPWLADSEAALHSGGWGGFSASAYFFAKELRRELKVPVGVIQSAWGGTAIEPWTPPQDFTQKQRAWEESTEKSYRDLVAKNLGALAKFEADARAALAQNKPMPAPPPAIAYPASAAPSAASYLFNGQIHPLIPYAIRGTLWYQGESNLIAGNNAIYADKMKDLVGRWRAAWGEGDFPFYFVQIAPFKYNLPADRLPEFWEAQTKAAKEIPNAGMAVINDIGDFGDIHPKNKQEVGRRLALLALEKTYGVTVPESTGPQFKSFAVEGAKLRLTFDHAAGLKAKDGKPITGFEVAGKDNVFAPATATVENGGVVLASDKVPAPTQARFAWTQCPVHNVCNGAGLPMNAFRTPVAGNPAK